MSEPTDGSIRRSDVYWDDARTSQRTAATWHDIAARDMRAAIYDDDFVNDAIVSQIGSRNAYKRARERYDKYVQTLQDEAKL